MPETKKLLVAFDPTRPNTQSKDFIVPLMKKNLPIFLGLTSGKEHTQGVVVYIGRSVSETDLFAKLVDSGAKISSVDDTLACLREYVSKLCDLRIGNVVQIVPGEGTPGSLGLVVIAATPSSARA